MIKKYLLILVLILFSQSVLAKGGANIFAYSRGAPQTPIYTPAGQKLNIQDFKGDFVLIMFWSRYCAPCIKELDEINEFVKKTRDNGIKVLLVSKEDEWSTMQEQRNLLIKYGAPDVDFYVDRDGKLAGDFGIFASPHTVLVSRDSQEIGRIRGTADWGDDDVVEYIYKIKATHG